MEMIHQRIVSWLQVRKRGSAPKTGGPAIDCITIHSNGSVDAFTFGHTAYGKGRGPKGGHKPFTIIEQDCGNPK